MRRVNFLLTVKMYRRYSKKKRSPLKKRTTIRRRTYKKRYARKWRKQVTPRLTPRGISVPVSRVIYKSLSTSADTIVDPAPDLSASSEFQRFANIYNKYRVMSIGINVVPHQNNAFYYNIQGLKEPLRYVVYRMAPDTLGSSTNPSTYREAMLMPGAKSYPLTRTCRRRRIALIGKTVEYLAAQEFTTSNTITVRQACRTPWLSTSMAEADDPLYWGWAVWFPQMHFTEASTNLPSFEIISVLNTRFISAVNL